MRSNRAVLGSLLLSCLLHGSLGVLTPALPAGLRARVGELPDQIEVTLQIAEPATPPPEHAAEPARTASSRRVDMPREQGGARDTRRTRAPLDVRTSDVPGAPREAPTAAAEAKPQPSSVSSAPAPAARSLDLSPHQVARNFLGDADELPTSTSGSTSGTPSASVSAAGRGATNESVAASLLPSEQGPLQGDREPLLFKRADGGYGFKGTGFDAIIRRDGTLELNDHYGKVIPPLVPFQLPDGSWRIGLGGAGFDLTAFMDHLAGNDPYRSERNWFLESTSVLRDKLAQKAADASTRARLLRLWSAPGLSMRERKQRVFAMWDECTEDVVGEHGRALIEGYVRDLCQPSDACRFTGEELASLNRQRRSQREFKPYAAVTPDKR